MRYKNEIYKLIHQGALIKYQIGVISEARLREYEEMCMEKEAEAVRDQSDQRK